MAARTPARLSEFALIERYFKAPAASSTPPLLGMGDDCALIAGPGNSAWAISTDTLVEGIHFFAGTPAKAIGHKALAVNLSDLAAMGATPRFALLAITLPQADHAWLAGFSKALFALANAHHCTLIGGDTTRGPLSINLTVIGSIAPARALQRARAKPGDDVWVSGTLGGAAAAVAHRKGELTLPRTLLAACAARLDYPTPRIALGQALAAQRLAHAALDISDGLLQDVAHMEAASGVTLVRDPALPLPLQAGLAPLGERAIHWAEQGGDDYELAFTAAPSKRRALAALSHTLALPLTRIGHLASTPSLEKITSIPFKNKGFQHF